jgi:Predicted soluble lytic transglycosylase fused to an ABC-type amino acid-binding protein
MSRWRAPISGARRLRASALILVLPTASLMLSTCSPHRSTLDRLEQTGVLRVATINSPVVCYQGAFGMEGFECSLVRGLAARMGLKVRFDVKDNAPAVLDAVRNGEDDLGAAALVIPALIPPGIAFSPPVDRITYQLAYHRGQPTPPDLEHLDGTLAVVAGSDAERLLRQIQKTRPAVHFSTVQGLSSEDLLDLVAKGKLAFTVANRDLIQLTRRYSPTLVTAFQVGDSQPAAFVLRNDGDFSLRAAVSRYIYGLSKKDIERLRARYFGPTPNFDYLGVVHFSRDIKDRLSRYRKLFKSAATQYHLDWRLLAAMGYQESHWDPAAVSPTGVHGLMMITAATAGGLDVDPNNSHQSIDGAARYLRHLIDALPDSVHQPDRTWMAVAAYNVGLGHVLDARRLAAELHDNPDRWDDVRKALLLLMQPRWYHKSHHGYAPGGQAVAYVANVRSYYDVLVWTSKAKTDHSPASRTFTPVD